MAFNGDKNNFERIEKIEVVNKNVGEELHLGSKDREVIEKSTSAL